MDCLRPLCIPNIQFLQSATSMIRTYASGGLYLGKNQLLADRIYNNTSSYIFVPCRKCPPCIRRRASEWSGRLAREIQSSINNGKLCAFVTLTYDNKYINSAPDTWRKDIATFFDRLRSKLRRTVRHFCISELGEKKGRFHIHCLLFDVDDRFAPNSHIWRDKRGYLHGSNDMLAERWRLGIVDTTIVKTIGAGVYIAGYLTKNKPTKDGQHYVSPIIASNGIGYKDVTQREISNIMASLDSNILPYYEVGGKRYQYPQSMINKYLTIEDKLKLSALSASHDYFLGGKFKLGTQRYNNYSEFIDQAKNYITPLLTFQFKKNETYFRSIKENTSFDSETTFLSSDSEVVNFRYPQTIAESIIYKYRNLMFNYTPF